MRDELHLMELVDRYLDGDMGEAERSAFDERMRGNAEMQSLVDDQRALREGLHRVELRGALASAHRRWAMRRWMPWGIAGLFMVVAGAWLLSLPTEHDGSAELPHAEAAATFENMPLGSTAPAQALTDTLELATRVETMFTHMPSKAGKWSDTSCGEGKVVTHLITHEADLVVERPVGSPQIETAQSAASATGASSSSTVELGVNYRPGGEIKIDSMNLSAVQPDAEKTVLATVERFENATKPEFPGGMEKLQRFIQENLKQPRGTKKSGTVTVGFTVNKKGEVANVEVINSLGRAFDTEAVRVISSMPKWEPSRLGDRPVKSKLEVHVRFAGTSRKSSLK